MGLSQSLYTGYSGMATHQKSMDNLSNNLANINTVGFKKSDFLFGSLFNKAISGAIQQSQDGGVVNPKGVGVGVSTGGVSTNFSSTAMETTSNPLDCAINGNGFFMVSTPRGTALTRAGSFYLDVSAANPGQRTLCAGTGYQVLGWNAVNGVITPSQTVTDIVLPAYGDKLNGEISTTAEVKGVLPSQSKSGDFGGTSTSVLELKGNLPDGESSLTTTIYVPTTTSGGSNPSSGDTEAVQVRIDFSGPATLEDGTTEGYSWTMTTVDWPSAGSEGVQIYPASGSTNETIAFYTQGSLTQGHGAGEAATDTINTTPSTVSSSYVDENGQTVTTSFTMPSNFTLDTSRLTHTANAPAGDLEVWYVDGNPTGTMRSTVELVDEYTKFESVTDENGVTTMQAVRGTGTRSNSLIFEKTETADSTTTWSWTSSYGGDSGTLQFNSDGRLIASTQTSGTISYDMSAMQYLNHEASVQLVTQDGYLDGYVDDIAIDGNGKIWAVYDNGVSLAVAQIALGTVANTSGLTNSAGTLFYPNGATGEILVGIAGDEAENFGLYQIGAGTISTSTLESSNVQLAQEFSTMIAVERGYQFSSKIITTADEMIQTALSLKT